MNTFRICNYSRGIQIFIGLGKMFGSIDGLKYYECSYWDCLQSRKVPEHLLKYYLENYYSFLKTIDRRLFPLSLFSRRIRLSVPHGIKVFVSFFLKIFWCSYLPALIKQIKSQLGYLHCCRYKS